MHVVFANVLVKRHVFLRFFGDALTARLVDLRAFLMDQWLEKAWRCESRDWSHLQSMRWIVVDVEERYTPED